MMESKKPTLFISYCHRDGSMYADDLEEELQGPQEECLPLVY